MGWLAGGRAGDGARPRLRHRRAAAAGGRGDRRQRHGRRRGRRGAGARPGAGGGARPDRTGCPSSRATRRRGAAPPDAVIAIGAAHAWGGGAAEALAGLRTHVTDGGRLLLRRRRVGARADVRAARHLRLAAGPGGPRPQAAAAGFAVLRHRSRRWPSGTPSRRAGGGPRAVGRPRRPRARGRAPRGVPRRLPGNARASPGCCWPPAEVAGSGPVARRLDQAEAAVVAAVDDVDLARLGVLEDEERVVDELELQHRLLGQHRA